MAERIKVCFISLQARGAFIPSPGAKIGGAEMQIRLLATHLAAQADFDVHLIVEDAGQAESEQIAGVTLWRISQPAAANGGLGRLKRHLVSARALTSLAIKLRADVYVQRCAGAETALAAHAAGAVGGALVYMMASDSECAPPWSRGGGLRARMFRHGLRRARLIMVQHEGQAESLRRLHAIESMIYPNVFDFAETSALSTPGAATRDAVLWVGRARGLKGPLHVLELARRLPDVNFILIAAPHEAEPDLVHDLRDGAQALSNVEFIPGLPSDQLAPYYERSGILLNTSDYEGMPNTFLEAAAHRLAIISLNADPGQILSRDRAGLWTNGDFEKLVAMLRGLAADPVGRSRWGERAFEILAERHDLAKLGPQFADALRALTHDRNVHP